MRINLRAAALAGLAGALSIDVFLLLVIAVVLRGDPMQLALWDASNLLGSDALHGSWGTAAIGTALHFAVSLVWGIVFVAIAARVPAVPSRPLLGGAIFGFAVMLVMRYAVVPLGHAALGGWTLRGFIIQTIAHTLFFGVPVAWTARGLMREANAMPRAEFP